jgi:hypothetical protein
VPACGIVDERLEERGLARAVGPDDRERAAALELEVDVVEDARGSERDAHVLDVEDDRHGADRMPSRTAASTSALESPRGGARCAVSRVVADAAR